MPLRRIAAGEGKSVFALGFGQSGPPIDNVLCTGVPRAGQVGKERLAGARSGLRPVGQASGVDGALPNSGRKCAPRRPAFRRTVSLHLRPGYKRVILTVRNISPWPNRLAPAAIRRRFEKPLRIRCAPAAVLAVFLHTACAQGALGAPFPYCCARAMHILFCSAERAGSRDCLP